MLVLLVKSTVQLLYEPIHLVYNCHYIRCVTCKRIIQASNSDITWCTIDYHTLQNDMHAHTHTHTHKLYVDTSDDHTYDTQKTVILSE